MVNLWKWVAKTPSSQSDVFWLFVQATGIMFLWNVIAIAITVPFEVLGILPPSEPLDPAMCERYFVMFAFFTLPIGAVCEEVIRLAPLMLVVWVTKGNKEWTLVTCVIVSLIFGALHYGGIQTSLIEALLMQGVGGFLMSMVYLKAGGIKGKVLYGLFVSTAVHTMFNCVVLSLVFLLQVLLWSVFGPEASICTTDW